MDTPQPSLASTDAPGLDGQGVELSVVVPTYNEAENVPLLVAKLDAVLAGVRWEAIFVDDDSRDGTARVVRALARTRPNVRVVQRIGRRGLSSACVEGALASSAPYIAVMDADLQHDERLLPKMLDALRRDGTEIVVGSRFVAGGSVGEFAANRVQISKMGARLARLVVKQDLSDPMSGFFMLRREVFERVVRRLSAKGFKILLDIFASAPAPLKTVELPFTFGARIKGESKLDTMVAWEYLMLLLDKMFGDYVPVRFLMFLGVGTVGLGVNFLTLWLTYRQLEMSFPLSLAIAISLAIAFNYWLNNIITYRDQRLRGVRFLYGFVSFAVICSVGALSNAAIAAYLFEREDSSWWLAGIIGGVIGAVWNYAMSSIFTWRVKPASKAPVQA